MSAPAQAPAREPVLERALGEFEDALARLPEEVVPRAARRRAAEQLRRLGWPQSRDEQWRYSNLRAFDRLESFLPASLRAAEAPAPNPSPPAPLPDALPGFERLVFVDGVGVQGQSAGGALVEAAPAGTLRFPGSESWAADQRLALLTEMLAQDAAVLRIRGEAALELLFVMSPRAAGAAVYPRVQIELAPGSRLTLVERHVGAAPGLTRPALQCATITVELARDAQLTHYRLQRLGPQTLFSEALSARLHEQAAYHVRHLGLGAESSRTAAAVQLAGRDARFSWQAIAVGRGQQVHDTLLRVQHAAPATRTDEVFRGIAEERARVSFSGHIHVEAGAPGAEAHQSLRGLIEGPAAEIDLRPRLQIDTDEVSAQHGAATGRLDEQLLFYLLARGIDRATARALLKWAFLGDVLRAIELPALRSQAEHDAAGLLQDVLAVGAIA
jgi:Fe-S cluster assembly protein SufD